MNVFAHAADGFEGWAEDAPYDRIIVNAAVEDLPLALLDQLKPSGVLLAPVGNSEAQRLIRYRNNEREDLGPVRFAPLLRGVEDGSVGPPFVPAPDSHE
jgi:protein-L-isoaspartate(D-aspartate) O-methyltransferase